MPQTHDRRGSGFNDQQFHELEIAVRAEVATATKESVERHEKILERLEAIGVRLEVGDVNMKALASGIEVNNQSTAEMRAAFDLAKRGLQVFGAIGTAISWVIRKGWPLWGPLAALIAWWKGMPPPTDHHH